jgi:excisionase family DNA binding protein
MRRKRRTEITIEAHRVLVIRRSRDVVRAWCEECAEPVRMVTPDEAAALAGVTARTIYRWVKAEKLHFTETPERSLLICLRSLPKAT